MIQPLRDELKTGNRPVVQQQRVFKAGETLFTEGSTGRELFIIQEGTVGVYKEGQEGKIELARLGAGSIVGEMSLLDALPRSATVIAVDEVKTLVVGYAQFQAFMRKVPLWLQSLIKIVVSRLRDADRRVEQPALRNRERGLVALIKLLLPVFGREIDTMTAIPRDTVLTEAYYVCRLRKKATEEILENMERRSIITDITSGDIRYIGIPDLAVLNLFEEHLVLKEKGQTFKELTIPPDTINMLGNIVYIAQKVGRETDEGTVLLKSALVEDLSSKDADTVDKRLLDLRRRRLVDLLPVENDVEILFRKETLTRIRKIQEWTPRFMMDIG